ncbi:MAG TPA: STAS domain-containing protein [Thermoanaerobaculia bacterium]|nr:STAS domain-containing protein [Thermoanaerobaculia bacterium]
METRFEPRGGVLVVALAGSLDALTAEDLSRQLDEQLANGHIALVADLADVDYTSSAGLRVLLATLKGARQRGGDLRLARVRADVLRVLEMSGFTSIMQIYDQVDLAVASFAS